MAMIEFSVLSYYPSIITNENINVGVLFHNNDTEQRLFYTMQNWRRLESFDDEVDVPFMRKYLKGIKAETENSLFNNEGFSMEDYTRFFVNELRFDTIRAAEAADPKEFIDTTIKMCMRYDFRSEDRLPRKSEVSYLKRLMRQGKIKYNIKPISGAFSERVAYDFVIDDHGFKVFEFEGKNLRRMVESAKAWSFTALSLRDKIRTVFIFDHESEDAEEFIIIKRILQENAEIVPSSNIISFIDRIKQDISIDLAS